MRVRAAVLSAGPSLEATWARRGYFYLFTVGVNTVTMEHLVDAWVFGDAHLARQVPRGHPWAFVSAGALHRILLDETPNLERFILGGKWEDVDTPGLAPEWWRVFSSTAALVLAGTREDVVAVDVYGADMAGTQDHRGQEGGRRDPTRWEQENRHWRRVVAWLKARGVEVVRVLP